MTETTIVVNTCDAYEDVWQLFFCALTEHWPSCKYKIVLNTESNKIAPSNVNVSIHNFHYPNDVDQWGLRLKQTLKDCDSRYVLMLYDDFVLEGPVDQPRIDECIKWLDLNLNIAVFYFNNNSANKNIDDNRFEKFELIPKAGEYKLNSAPAIWRREKLLEFIEDNDTPWGWELFGSYRTYKIKDLFYCAKKEHEDIYPYSYAMGGAIYRGRWVGSVVLPLIKKYELPIDVTKRGLADGAHQDNKRSLIWKIQFFSLGFRMIGFGVLLFIYRILKKKIGILLA